MRRAFRRGLRSIPYFLRNTTQHKTFLNNCHHPAMRDIQQLRIGLKAYAHESGCVSHLFTGPYPMFRRRFALLALSALTLCFTIHAAAQATCTLSSTNRTITICAPSTGTTVGTTFRGNAAATDTYDIQYIELYVANVRYAIQHANYLDATITVPAGSNQNLTVQAHDSAGVTFKSTIHVNVSATAPYSISPQNPTLVEGSTQQFSASTASTWSASCGSINSSGLFTAPSSVTTCTVKGTAKDGSGSASTTVNVVSSDTQATCTLSTTNQTVTICTPSNGATVSTNLHVNAGTTDTSTIQYIELYVANKRYAVQHTNYLDATVTVPAGSNQ